MFSFWSTALLPLPSNTPPQQRPLERHNSGGNASLNEQEGTMCVALWRFLDHLGLLVDATRGTYSLMRQISAVTMSALCQI